MHLVILLWGDGILTEEVLETVLLAQGILHLRTCRFDPCLRNGHACLGGNDAAGRSLRTLFRAEKICLGLCQPQAKLSILNNDECVPLLYLLKIGKAYLSDKTLYTAALRHDILTDTGIVGKFSTAEVHKLADHISCSAQKAKYDECII